MAMPHTSCLLKMIHDGHLNTELIFNYLHQRDLDLPDDRAKEITDTRIMIFNSYHRTVENVKTGYFFGFLLMQGYAILVTNYIELEGAR